MKSRFHLLVLYTLLFLSTSTKAQDSLRLLPGITIQSNRLQVTLTNASRVIALLSQHDLKNLPGMNLNAWLSTVSGVDIRQRGPEGIQADAGIRGGSFDQTLVMVNGIKLSDAQTGHHMMHLPVTREAIEQIEVIKSSASRLYGINALAGAVNIITHIPASDKIYGGAYAGDFNLYGWHTGAVFHHGQYGHHLSYSQSSSHGFRPNTDFNNQTFFYQFGKTLRIGKLSLVSGYGEKQFGASGFYAPKSNEFEKIKTGFASLRLDQEYERLNLRYQIYHRYLDDDYVYNRFKPALYHNHHFAHTSGAEIHATYRTAFGVTGIGFDYRLEQLNSNNLGKRKRNILGGFAEHRFELLKQLLSITPGVYLNTIDNKYVSFFPGVDASMKFLPGWTAFAAIDKGMRLPTYTDLYYQGANNTGNPDLKPEEAVNTELGIRFNPTKVTLGISVFNRANQNLIDWARQTSTEKWKPLNIDRVNFTGYEIHYKQVFTGILQSVSCNYTYLHAQFHQPESYMSLYTLSNIRHHFTGSLSIRWSKQLHQTISLRHISRVAMNPYTLADTRLICKLKYLTPFTEISNVFNTAYQEAGYVPMPGRWFKAGIEFEIHRF